jgi:hypothetical protein
MCAFTYVLSQHVASRTIQQDPEQSGGRGPSGKFNHPQAGGWEGPPLGEGAVHAELKSSRPGGSPGGEGEGGGRGGLIYFPI